MGNYREQEKTWGLRGEVEETPHAAAAPVFESTPISGQPTLATTSSAFHGSSEGNQFPVPWGKERGRTGPCPSLVHTPFRQPLPVESPLILVVFPDSALEFPPLKPFPRPLPQALFPFSEEH